MALTVNLRHLEDKNLRIQGHLTPEELDIESLDQVIRVTKPLNYDLEVQMMDESLLLEGQLSLPLSCDCVRCLKPFEHTVLLENWSAHVPLTGDDAAPVNGDFVDLTPYVREDILLDFPQHPLCSTECGGLPKSYKDKGKAVENPDKKQADSSAWGELNKLKLQ
jgi:uncharacterized protein